MKHITQNKKDEASAQQDAMRTTLLAQMRVSLAELQCTQAHVEFVGSALRNRLITPHQAMAMAYEHDVLDCIFPDGGGSA